MTDICNDSLSQNIDLFHPEILTASQLCCLLQKKNICIDESDQGNKDKLLEIFHRTLLPLPQRDYRPNRRGALLMKDRKKCVERKKIEAPLSSKDKTVEPPHKMLKVTGEKPKTVEVPRELKERISPVVPEKKIVRLTTKSCNGLEAPVRSNSSPSPTSNSKSKVIKLINDTLMSNAKSSPHSDSKKVPSKHKIEKEAKPSSEEEVVKKKHKPITWP